jgi:hypothetical protein
MGEAVIGIRAVTLTNNRIEVSGLVVHKRKVEYQDAPYNK